MAAPNITYTVSANKLSSVSGYDSITVTFSSDIAYTDFECRATKNGAEWGVGVGKLIASFSSTPANTERTFEIYDEYLLNGDGVYRISLLAQSETGEWNDTETNYARFIASGDTDALITSDGLEFFCKAVD